MKKEVIQLLKDLVSIPSYIGKENKAAESKVEKYLLSYFAKNLPNFTPIRIPFEGKRSNLIFKNSKDIRLLFACHMDTVPPSSKNAFKLKIKGDQAFGLGTKDMKGGIVSTLMALSQTTKEGVGIVFYGDEETSFKGINNIADNSLKIFKSSPELIVSPESRFNLGVGARGIVVFGIKVFGLKTHSARPHLGADAIRGFFRSIEQLEKKLNQKTTALGLTTINVAFVNGGLLGDKNSIHYHIGTVPDYLEAKVSIRNAKVELDGKKYMKLITDQLATEKLKVDITLKEDYPARSTPTTIIKKVEKLISKATGKKVEVADQKSSGYNDVAILSRKLNTSVVNFGPYGEGNHTKDEWVSIQSLIDTSEVFKKLIEEIC